MQEQTMSISKGTPASRAHNLDAGYRATLANVDETRTDLNVVLCDTPMEEMYDELFGQALSDYNARQKRDDRRIDDYLSHIAHSKQEKPCYEVVVQLGNRDTMPADDERCREVCHKVYEDFVEAWKARYPSLPIAQAVIHMDEATPHMHVVFVPVSHRNKRGLETKNSFRGAMRECGFEQVGDLYQDMYVELECVSQQHGIARLDGLAGGRDHLTVEQFKMRAEEVGYPYKNDPELIDQLERDQRTMAQLVEQVEVCHKALQGVAETPVNVLNLGRLKDAQDEAKRALEGSRKALGPLAKAAAVAREFLAAIPVFWRDHIKPVLCHTDDLDSIAFREGVWVGRRRSPEAREDRSGR